LELPKGYSGVLHRHMGKVKKFGPSRTLMLRRNRRPKKCGHNVPPRTIRVKNKNQPLRNQDSFPPTLSME